MPDPNRFGGEVELCKAGGTWQAMPITHGYADDNYRILGLVDMAVAIADGRPHRASGALAFHVLEVMEALVRLQRGARHRHDREPLRAAGADAGRSCDRRDGVRGEAG